MRYLLLILICLSGCADTPPAAPEGDEFSEFDVSADATTGVIRGIVVDTTIRPLPDVEVRLMGTDEVGQTNAEGLFAFGDLEPGFYQVEASRPGFLPARIQTTVEAGVLDPPIVRLQLEENADGVPFHDQIVWNGFIACAAPGANYCALPRLYTGVDPFSDDSVRLFYEDYIDLARTPDTMQSETIWRSTQATGNGLQQRFTSTDPDLLVTGSFHHVYGWVNGPSPLINRMGFETLAEGDLGTEMGLNIENFSETTSVVIEQKFNTYITNFYGYIPPDDWTFVEAGNVPEP